jgi:DNA polymerase III alpha subunit (gram-positive type)
MGLNGEKDPCIDIQTTPEMCEEVARFLKDFIGKDRIAFAGDTHDITERLAGGYAKHYAEQYNLRLSDEEIARITKKLSGVKREDVDRTCSYVFLPEGMHWEDVTPLRDAVRPRGGIDKVTHMEQSNLKLHKLGVLHNDRYRVLADLFSLTGVKAEEIDYSDPKVYPLFQNLDFCVISDFRSENAKKALAELDDIHFSALVRINRELYGTAREVSLTHAAHYTKLAASLAWFKCHYPEEFDQVLFPTEEACQGESASANKGGF